MVGKWMSKNFMHCKRGHLGNFCSIYQRAYGFEKKKPGSIVLYEGQNSFALTQGQFCEKDPPCIKKKPFLANKFNCASLF